MITKQQLDILVQLAEADKHFAQVEREMIFSIARNNQFSEEEIRNIIKNPQPIEPMEELSFDQKFGYLISSIELVFADQKVFEKEVLFCENIASKLGFKKAIINFFIEQYGKKTHADFKQIAFDMYLADEH